MILSGNQIRSKIGNEIIIRPFEASQLNPNSYNLRLHNELLVYEHPSMEHEPALDMRRENKTRTLTIPASGMVMEPQVLYLARTVEYTETHGYVPMLEGRSSVGRLGLCVHVTAGFGDVGFAGYWTLEMFCIHPIRIYPGVEICQIYYHTIDPDHEPYNGKYQHNGGILPSLLYRDFEEMVANGLRTAERGVGTLL